MYDKVGGFDEVYLMEDVILVGKSLYINITKSFCLFLS